MILCFSNFTIVIGLAQVTQNYSSASPSHRLPHGNIFTNNTSFLSSVLLLNAWPQCILPSTIIVFFDNNGHQFLSIKDVQIGKEHTNGAPSISLTDMDIGALLFSTLILHKTPLTIIVVVLCCRM
jgi:hypothetical protein